MKNMADETVGCLELEAYGEEEGFEAEYELGDGLNVQVEGYVEYDTDLAEGTDGEYFPETGYVRLAELNLNVWSEVDNDEYEVANEREVKEYFYKYLHN